MAGFLKKIFKGATRVARAVSPTAAIVHGATKKGGNVFGNVGKSFLQSKGDAALGAAALGAGYLAAPAIGGAASSAGGALGGGGALGAGGAAKAAGPGILSKVFGGIGKYGPDLLGAGISAYGAVEGAKAQKKGDAMQQAALDMAMREYAANEPLRAKARSLMLAQAAPRQDLSALYRSQNNPFG